MIKLTHHSKLRCVQRVFGITNEQKARVFLLDNEEKVSYKLWEMLSESKLIYENFSYDVGITNNYYLYGDFILITASDSRMLITLYKLKFNTKDITDNYLLNKYIKTISYNRDTIRRIKDRKKKVDSKSRSIELAIEKLKKQILELEIDLDESVGDAVALVEGRKSLTLENESVMQGIVRYLDIDSSELKRREYSL